MAHMNKTRAIENHLRNYGSITSLEAINRYGATRLAAIIFNLRREGYIIESKDESGTDRFGNATHYVRYMLLLAPPEEVTA